MCAKPVLKRGKFDSRSKQSLNELIWLPVKARITLKDLAFMFICSNWNASAYLTELLLEQDLEPIRLMRTISSSKGCNVVPASKTEVLALWACGMNF